MKRRYLIEVGACFIFALVPAIAWFVYKQNLFVIFSVYELGRLFGFLAFGFFVAGLLISFKGSIFRSIDKLYVWHQIFMLLSGLFAFLHMSAFLYFYIDNPLFRKMILVPDINFPLYFWGVLAGWGLWLVIIVTYLFVYVLPYRWWRFFHMIGGLAFLSVVFHLLEGTAEFTKVTVLKWLVSFYVFVGLLVVLVRMINRFVTPIGVRYRVSQVKKLSENYLRIVLKQEKGFFNNFLGFLFTFGRSVIRPGDFVFLYVPSKIRKWYGEHPFTVIKSTEDSLELVVKKQGAGTKRLYKLNKGDVVYVNGGFGTLYDMMNRYPSNIVFISAGVGVTPFLAALYLFPKNVKLFYVFREQKDNLLNLLGIKAKSNWRLFSTQEERRRINKEDILEFLKMVGTPSLIVVTGPLGFVKFVKKVLKEARFKVPLYSENVVFNRPLLVGVILTSLLLLVLILYYWFVFKMLG